MTRKQALIDLRDKVKAGEWPGHCVFHDMYDDFGLIAFRAYSGSLDAAKALHEAWSVELVR